jgi:hypothetical protein
MNTDAVRPQDIQDFLDEQLQEQEERPDKTLLRNTVELIEQHIPEFDFKDERCESGEVIQVGDENVTMQIISIQFVILDKDRKDGRVEWLFSNWFEPVARSLVAVIGIDGYNVCRPLGIRDPNLTANTGALQLTYQGQKLDIHMSHLYHETGDDGPYTEVKLELLVGKL